jgi:myo-inositol-1(or 4)-monophosphatase
MTSFLVESMTKAARAGARILLDGFGRLPTLAVTEKGPSDFVSQADIQSERAIKDVLAATHPAARFQAEETVADRATTGPRFVVDPLDGTTNFLRGIPHFAVTIAYADDSGIVAGVVLDPTRDELFWAERGEGAYLGDRPLRASTRASLENAVVHTGVPHRGRGDHRAYLGELERVMAEVAGVRRLGAAALDFAYVAAGRGDAFFEHGLSPWDIAAGIVLVTEAGGVVTDLEGGSAMDERKEVVAAGALVHAPLLRALRPR